MPERIVKISQAFLESYQEFGGINHISGPNLPSRYGVKVILEDIENLLFPGFKTEEAIDHGSLSFTVTEKINRLLRNLSLELTRSLCWERRLGGDEDVCEHSGSTQKLNLICKKEAENLAVTIVERLPEIRRMLHSDVEAAYAGDPAAKSHEEVILSYPGIDALTVHRVAHELYLMKIPLIPRLMSELAHARTGIDIHPGANIGSNFFIDHGTGVVIGETTLIGNNVKIYQGVTLGAASVKKESANAKRHPTLEDDVTVYAGATILGGQTVIGRGSVVGGNVWITSSLPAGSRVYNKDAEYIVRNTREYTPDFQI